jgi:acyl-CoA thioesterase FadM
MGSWFWNGQSFKRKNKNADTRKFKKKIHINQKLVIQCYISRGNKRSLRIQTTFSKQKSSNHLLEFSCHLAEGQQSLSEV